ncbi:MAG: zinc-ribbon domain-containing protein [Planctomycetota bacterium]|jgi:predicted Zn finger-like uncharacterized protein|nr:zinc-ribbon domain-containing protein [Planctomycetota bacterium]MDP6938112.1 zinc-ribbon domain-containing protein [Planctomycetota bacterium]
MIIECTSCGARAKLPDSKEGAKVRCGECSHIYVARPPGARRSSKAQKDDPTKYFIIGGAVVVFGLVMLIVNRGKGDPPPVVEAAPPVVEEDTGPSTGWDSPHVLFARQMHDLAFSKNTSKLFVVLDFAKLRDHEIASAATATPEGEQPVTLAGYTSLDGAAQTAYRNTTVDGLTSAEGEMPVSLWKPYDGDVVAETEKSAIVRLHVQSRSGDPDLSDRWMEWEFVRGTDMRWKAWRWERWISPEEEKRERTRRTKKTVRKTLSDGSEVIEGVVREEIAYHAETTPEQITEIEGLIGQLINMEARPKEITAARGRLEEIGKHAVPGLLKRMGGIPLESEENAIQLNLIHMLLSDITQYQTTFVVHVAMGGTQERIDSGIKQWFGWYDRKWKRFWREADSREEEIDPFWDNPNYKPRNENERQRMEALRRKAEGGN